MQHEIKMEIKSLSPFDELGNARGNNVKQGKPCFEVHGIDSQEGIVKTETCRVSISFEEPVWIIIYPRSPRTKGVERGVHYRNLLSEVSVVAKSNDRSGITVRLHLHHAADSF